MKSALVNLPINLSVKLALLVVVSGSFAGGWALPAGAEEKSTPIPTEKADPKLSSSPPVPLETEPVRESNLATSPTIGSVSDLQPTATTGQQWMAQADAAGSLAGGMALPAGAEEKSTPIPTEKADPELSSSPSVPLATETVTESNLATSPIIRVSDLQPTATTVQEWMAQADAAGSLAGGMALPAGAEEKSTPIPTEKADPKLSSSPPVPLETETVTESNLATSAIIRVSDLQPTATTVQEWRAQADAAIVKIIGVKIAPTEQGIDITLETEAGTTLATPTTRTQGQTFYTDIPNAVLSLAEGNEFKVENPAEGIANISVTQVSPTFVQVLITGIDGLPRTQVSTNERGLVISSTLSTTMAESEDDEVNIIVVTGVRDAYRVPNSSVGTRTDTPLRDIPQSIQVVPQEVLRDQNVTRQEEALRNISGVVTGNPPYYQGSFYRIRGFLIENFSGNNLTNGIPDFVGGLSTGFSNVERVEVLKGPASVLFGQGNPGGTINTVTKQPLREPFYEFNATVGNYDFYQGAIDLSGPLDNRGNVLYRLNTSYRSAGSSIDLIENKNFQIAPVLSWAISDTTKLTLEGDYVNDSVPPPTGVPALGSVLFNPNGEISHNRNYNESNANQKVNLGRVGYRLEHEFSDSWSLRHAFFASFYDLKVSNLALPTGLQPDNRTLNRRFLDTTRDITSYVLASDVTGKISTGSIEHQLTLGFDFNDFYNRDTGTAITGSPIDIFNPVFGQPIDSTPAFAFDNATDRTALGIYTQDQITIAENLKLLLGLRFDTFTQTVKDREASTEQEQSENAFSPRVGIVYQPIPPISLYASYSQSFSPVNGRSFENAQFQPERGTQYEVGVKADLSDRLSATLAFYDLLLSNVLTNDPVNPDFSVQTGKQRSRGIEMNLSGAILPGWNILAGYAYTDARIEEDNALPVGNRLANVPKHSFNLWTTYEIQAGKLKGLGFGLGLFYVGERQGDLDNSFEIPSYLRTDAAIFYQQDNWRTSLNVKNLFGVEYFESSFNRNRLFAGEDITIQGTISWQF
ncbi:TonB-dependent siderophore receptor [Microcoleus vaginatus]|uniref:TonB-dependent siderophore receptor n=1 Tax=Microcoleus vaginatus TaxID=119532 RepID=UPI0032A894ED